jgi:hypothetical protein
MTLRQQHLDLSADAKQGEFLAEWIGEEGLRRYVLPIQEFNRMITGEELQLPGTGAPTEKRRIKILPHQRGGGNSA